MNLINQIEINGEYQNYAIWRSLILANSTHRALIDQGLKARVIDENGVEIAVNGTGIFNSFN